MNIDVMEIYGACSYALDCVEAELVHVTNRHAKRVAYMSVCLAETMGFQGNALQDLAACALLHDNALTQYIKEELHNNIPVSSEEINPSQACAILKDMADKGWIDANIVAQLDICFS